METEEEIELGFEKDEELKETESRIRELRKKTDRTPEEETEFKELKRKHNNNLTSQIEEEKLRAKREEQRATRLERELEELKSKQVVREEPKKLGTAETIQINGKEFYTDRGLTQLVQANQMSQEDAWAHQEERREEKAVARLKDEQNKTTNQSIYEETKNEVLKEHPEFAPNHPDHDPTDPLFKEADELWRAGLYSNPRGLKIALDKAKRLLGKDLKRPNLSDELGVTRSDEPASNKQGGEKKVTLNEAEKETAWAYYRTQKNPKTNKSYTMQEAIEIATKSKQNRKRV